MDRTYVVTGSASGIGAATAQWLARAGARVIGCDLHDADVIADLASEAGRAALADGVARVSGGRVDGVIANAGGGPPETMLQLNFFGAVATLQRLRPLLAKSDAPRAVAVSSIGSMREDTAGLIEACLAMDEEAAVAGAWRAYEAGALGRGADDGMPDAAQVPLALYGAAKAALQRWCRKTAPTPEWAGAGITLNVVALGFYDTPGAAYLLGDPERRAATAELSPLAGSFPGRPEAAAALLAWLAGPDNTQMTGQILFADGGFECRVREEKD
ncbi:MAG TPA: SDR family oxidoreductase [Caulobacteraceae bacterium]|nr:SDR family oxidoreductase [Caulobacteraceae bacterium]